MTRSFVHEVFNQITGEPFFFDACLPACLTASPRYTMAQRPRSERSTEAPMDFQFTSRPSVDLVPVWKSEATPLKREYVSRYTHGTD
jgi:hypothetical protein